MKTRPAVSTENFIRGVDALVFRPGRCGLGTLALRTGKQVDYDPATMSFKDASLNQYLKAPVRKRWEYGEALWQ